MFTITGHDQHSAWQNKTLPAVEEVRPGVFSIPVTFPNNPMRYTISYLLLGDGEAVLVDPGWDSDGGWAELLAGFRLAGLGTGELTGIVVTHFHPDHLGMAGRLQDASGAWLALGEAEESPAGEKSPAGFVAGDRSRFIRWGVPAGSLDEVAFSVSTWSPMTRMATPDVRLSHGEPLPIAGLDVRAVATPGHTKGHICLLDEKRQLILTGDHVLPRITPHVSLETNGLANPLADYYRSLDAVDLGDDFEVLPAHEYRFRGIRSRLEQLRLHGDERSDEVRAILAGQNRHTVWDVAKELSWSRGWESLNGFNLRLALAETASHLVYVRSLGTDVTIDTGSPSDALAG